MTWYDPSTWFESNEEKANRAQAAIAQQEGTHVSTDAEVSYAAAFDKLESVGRGASLIINAAASLDFDIKDKVAEGVIAGMRAKNLHTLLNFKPNPHQSAYDFRLSIFTDFILEGNIFIYYDGVHIYHLPAKSVTIVPDPITFVKEYIYLGGVSQVKFAPNEIIHIKDINSSSIMRGTSRLSSADRNIKILYKMQTFQEQFFDNGAVAGIVITTENTLSAAAKEKTVAMWSQKYSPRNGARKPLILDSGMKPAAINQATFQEMDFDASVKTHDTKILKSLGVPPLLLDGGNNANISPNLKLFYLETVLPIVNNFVSAFERFTGYDIAPVTNNVSALQPELKEVAAYHSTLVNTGILTANEARTELRYENVKDDPEADKLRVPANIAGSAANPSQGGAPKKPADAPKT